MEAVCVWILVIWLLRLYLFEKKEEEEEEEEEDDDDDEEESFTTMTWHAWFFFSYLFVVYVRLQIEGFLFLALSYV